MTYIVAFNEEGGTHWRQGLARFSRYPYTAVARKFVCSRRARGEVVGALLPCHIRRSVRAIRRASAIAQQLSRWHRGSCRPASREVEFLDDDVRGIAVHLAARVSALGRPLVKRLVSRTVRDPAAGSGIAFLRAWMSYPERLAGAHGDFRGARPDG